VSAEGLHVLRWVAANEFLKIAFLEIAFQRIDTRNAQHRRMKEAVDHVEGGNLRRSPAVAKTLEQVGQGEDIADILLELVQLPIRLQYPCRHRCAAHLPAKGLVALLATSLVFVA